MKFGFPILTAALLLAAPALAKDRIYRCGNEYTNTVTEELAKSCKLVSGGNVTVVQAVRPNPNSAVKVASSSSSSNQSVQRVDAIEQRAKDSDARFILESELKKAETRQLDLQREYNNGEPEKLGPETRNNQKYLDRIAELQANIARNESDIAGIRRELGRVPAASSSSAR